MKQNLLTMQQRSGLAARLGIRFLLFGAAVLLIGRFGPGFVELTMPFLLGWGMAVLLDPLIRWVEKRIGVSRRTVCLVVVLGLIALAGGAVFAVTYYAGRELVDLARNWNGLFGAFQGVLDSLELMFAKLFAIVPPELTATVDVAINEVLLWMEETIPEALKSLGERATDKFMGVPSFVVATIMFIMGTYFIAADYPNICRRATENMGQGITQLLGQIRNTALVAFGGYLKAQVLLSVGVFCILLLGFLVTGQQYAFLLALGLAVLDFIPLLGAGTVMVPWAVIALLTRNFRTAAVIMVIWGVIAVYRRVAEPKIVGDQTGLSPVLSLFSIYIGMKTAGVIGMILGPILVLVVLNLVRGGMFSGLFRDLRLAGQDIAALLSAADDSGAP